jgi:hypothetical protein
MTKFRKKEKIIKDKIIAKELRKIFSLICLLISLISELSSYATINKLSSKDIKGNIENSSN